MTGTDALFALPEAGDSLAHWAGGKPEKLSVCPHVAGDAPVMVMPPRPRHYADPVLVACPCCGLHAWQDGEFDGDGDPCPYCDEQPVRGSPDAARCLPGGAP